MPTPLLCHLCHTPFRGPAVDCECTAPSRRRLRCQVRAARSKVFPDGQRRYVRAFGVRLGYWPCLRAPFIEIAFNHRRFEVWHGLPSYRAD